MPEVHYVWVYDGVLVEQGSGRKVQGAGSSSDDFQSSDELWRNRRSKLTSAMHLETKDVKGET